MFKPVLSYSVLSIFENMHLNYFASGMGLVKMRVFSGYKENYFLSLAFGKVQHDTIGIEPYLLVPHLSPKKKNYHKHNVLQYYCDLMSSTI